MVKIETVTACESHNCNHDDNMIHTTYLEGCQWCVQAKLNFQMWYWCNGCHGCLICNVVGSNPSCSQFFLHQDRAIRFLRRYIEKRRRVLTKRYCSSSKYKRRPMLHCRPMLIIKPRLIIRPRLNNSSVSVKCAFTSIERLMIAQSKIILLLSLPDPHEV